MQIAIVLMITATISYYVLPMIKPLHYWQSTGIFFCLVVAYIAAIRERRVYRPLPTAQPTGQRPAHSTADPVTQLTQMMEAMNQVAPAFVAPNAPVQVAAPTAAPVQAKTPKPENALQAEANAINGLLRAIYGLDCLIPYWKRGSIMEAPDFIGYLLDERTPLKFEDLRKLETDLARQINSAWRKYQYGDVEVIAVDSQPIMLQVTHPKPTPLLWAERPATSAPMTAVLGHYWIGTACRDLVIDLRGDEWVNGAFYGMPGSGKSTAMHEMMIGLTEGTPPDKLHVYGIDTKANAFSIYEGVPHFQEITGDPEKALEILKQFEHWCSAEGWPKDDIYRVLAIDEVQRLITHSVYGKTVVEKLNKNLEAGREPKIRVLLTVQNPTRENFPIKANIHFQGCAHIMNDDYVRRQLHIYGASKLRSMGEMMFKGPDGEYRVKTFWLTNEDRAAAIERIKAKWHGAPTGALVIEPGTAPVRFPIKPARPPSEAEAQELRRMAAFPVENGIDNKGKLSLTKLTVFAYGAKRSDRMEWIKEAIGYEAQE